MKTIHIEIVTTFDDGRKKVETIGGIEAAMVFYSLALKTEGIKRMGGCEFVGSDQDIKNLMSAKGHIEEAYAQCLQKMSEHVQCRCPNGKHH